MGSYAGFDPGAGSTACVQMDDSEASGVSQQAPLPKGHSK